MEQKEFGEQLVTLPLLINGVLFTISLVILQNLLGASTLAPWQTASLILFAIGLPCLAGYAFVIFAIRAAKVDPQKRTKKFIWLQNIGLIADLSGIWASFMNSSKVAGLIFLGVSLVTLVICAITYNHINDLHISIYGKKAETTEGTSPDTPKKLPEEESHQGADNARKTSVKKPQVNRNNQAPPS